MVNKLWHLVGSHDHTAMIHEMGVNNVWQRNVLMLSTDKEYPIKYNHSYDVFCFVLILLDNSYDLFTNITVPSPNNVGLLVQGCFFFRQGGHL